MDRHRAGRWINRDLHPKACGHPPMPGADRASMGCTRRAGADVHSSGDLTSWPALRFSPGACEGGAWTPCGRGRDLPTRPWQRGRGPMAGRKPFANPCTPPRLGPALAPEGGTRSAERVWRRRWLAHPRAVVHDRQRPHRPGALAAADRRAPARQGGAVPPTPCDRNAGGVRGGGAQQASTWPTSGLSQIRLEGSRGGAGLAGAPRGLSMPCSRRAWLESG